MSGDTINQLKLLIRTSRPIVWLWFAYPFIAGAVLGGADMTNPLIWLQFLALGPIYCLFVYGVNDVYDYETDLKNERKGEGKSQGDILEPEYHGFVMQSSGIAALLLLLIALSTGDLFNILGMVFLLSWAYTYSAPPVRLKERPVIDSLSNGLGYLLVPVAMGFSLGSPVLQLPVEAFWIAFVVSGLHAMFAVFDYEPDKKVGVNTIAVRFGPKTIFFPLVAIIATLLFSGLDILISRFILLQLLVLVILAALDVYGHIEFKDSIRAKMMGLLYLEGLILVTAYLLKLRYGLF